MKSYVEISKWNEFHDIRHEIHLNLMIDKGVEAFG